MRISDWSSDVCSSDLFGDGFARRFDRQHRIMTLAVLRDLVGELLQAPGFGLVDRALIFADDVGDGFRQCIDLSLAHVLTPDKDMPVQLHGCASFPLPDPLFPPHPHTPPTLVRLLPAMRPLRNHASPP